MGWVDEQYESKIVCRPEDLYFTIAHGFLAACPIFFLTSFFALSFSVSFTQFYFCCEPTVEMLDVNRL